MYRQPKKQRILVITVGLLLCLLAFNLTAAKDLPPLRFSRAVLFSTVTFTANAARAVLGWFNPAPIFELWGIRDKYFKLEDRFANLEARNQFYDDLISENQQLRGLLGFRAGSYYPRLMASQVIGRSTSNWFETIIIDRGGADGLRGDKVVISPEGLVGRTFDVARHSAKVLLLTDPNSAISAVDQNTRDIGIVVGRKAELLLMRYVSPTANIAAGDLLVTSGVSAIFPKGIRIGTVQRVEKRDYDIFQHVEVSPAVNFSKLDKVFVIY